MLKLITIVTMVLSMNAMADCSVTLKTKSDTAKNAKLDGVSFSAKQIDALKTICTVNLKLMNKEELIEDFKASLDRKEAKLAAKK